jgi:hypothetical protein
MRDLVQTLDGWWDFAPLADGGGAAAAAYAEQPIRVPGYWNRFPDDTGGDWGAYDHYRYPAEWNAAAAAVYRCRFTPDAAVERAGRVALRFGAVAGLAAVTLNGQQLGENRDSFLPFELDVTGLVQAGQENELLVRVDPPPQRDGLWLQPCGSWVGWYLRGIWQSVELVATPAAAIGDVFVQPSVRARRLTVEVAVAGMAAGRALRVAAEVLDGDAVVLTLPAQDVTSESVPLVADWADARLWSPEDPHLYHVRVDLLDGEETVHTRTVRFGFREFWIEGTGFRLNGEPIRLFGDSWHYMGVAQQNPAYARVWFEFARSIGVNAIRTHAMPYPPCYFEIADELGMLIIDETAVYGSAGTLAYAEGEFWKHCRDHMRRLVKRDRNHPSIIFWSACNETVWKGGEGIFPELVSLAEEAKKLDPTRFVSFDENDCELGGAAPLHAGHYGTPQHWDRSWRRDRPLVVHEFSALYHGGPDNVCMFGDELVYADYRWRLLATGIDAAAMFLRLRALGAASITPWNLNWYCLEPGPVAAVEEVPEHLTAGGPAFDRIGPRALTLNYGYDGERPACVAHEAIGALAPCYVRQRTLVERLPQQGFAGDVLALTPAVWNDTNAELEGRVELAIEREGAVLVADSVDVRLEAYGHTAVTLRLEMPAAGPGDTRLALRLCSAESEATLFEEYARFWIADRAALDVRPDRTVQVVGELPAGARVGWSCGAAAFDASHDTVLLAAGAPERTLNAWLDEEGVDDWVRGGGRLVVLAEAAADDSRSKLSPVRRTFEHAFVRGLTDGPLRGLHADDLRNWGREGVVARHVFERPQTGPAWTPLDVGDAAAGLAYTPLVILPHGAGHIVLCGLDLAARAGDTPAAALLLRRLAEEPLVTPPGARARQYGDIAYVQESIWAEAGCLREASDDASVLVCDGTSRAALDSPALRAEAIAEHCDGGGTLVIDGLTPETAAVWAARLQVELPLVEDVCYNVARVSHEPLMQHLNNFDLCWVLRDLKQPIVRYTLPNDLPGARPLVETVATRWEDYQTAHEQCKVGTMFRRLERFAGARAAVVEIPRGPGRILINLLELNAAWGIFRERARRIASRWLDALGVERDAAVSPLTPREGSGLRGDGYITDWLVLGPFGGADDHPLDHAFVDEAAVRPVVGAELADRQWVQVATAFQHVDLDALWKELPERDRVAYAAVYVHAAMDRSVLLDAPDMVTLLIGGDGGTKAILNGEVLGRFDFVRELVLDNDRVENVPLRKGWNTLVIKLHNPSGAWRFAARFLSAAGEPVDDIRVQTTPPAEGE